MANRTLVYVGTYTEPEFGGTAEGIYTFALDAERGELAPHAPALHAANPSYLSVHERRRLLFAVHELSRIDGEPTGALSAYKIDEATGALKRLNGTTTGGRGPCYVAVDSHCSALLVANYGAGSVAAIPIAGDGALGEATAVHRHEGSSVNPSRQEAPHAHAAVFSPDERFVYVPDLGIDTVKGYRFDGESGALTPAPELDIGTSGGAGLRHIAFHPDRPLAVLACELDSTVTSLRYDPESGTLSPAATVSALPEEYAGESTCAAIRVHPAGRWVYVSNRGHDTIACFELDAESGELRAAGHFSTGGRTPRDFAIDPSGRVLIAANQDSDSMVVFSIDAESGALTRRSTVETPTPVCVVPTTLPAG